ncbi:hypothetical protein EON73_02565, partial [bacterium]
MNIWILTGWPGLDRFQELFDERKSKQKKKEEITLILRFLESERKINFYEFNLDTLFCFSEVDERALLIEVKTAAKSMMRDNGFIQACSITKRERPIEKVEVYTIYDYISRETEILTRYRVIIGISCVNVSDKVVVEYFLRVLPIYFASFVE